MKILAIDTSTDETSVAVTEGQHIVSNVISSQVRYHKKFGGVVPMLAARLHGERIDSVVELALQRAKFSLDEIDAVAVTYGPGLAPALQVGINKAKELAVKVPLYAVNHMRGHIASAFSGKHEMQFPFLAVLVSGGHSELVLVEKWGSFEILGETLDDALGEAYDKVGRMLGLGYPAGKLIANLAAKGNAEAYDLPVPMLRGDTLNLSYSGLKNACRLLVKAEEPLTATKIADIAASFERVAQESLYRKVKLIVKDRPEIKQVVLAGGVSANTALRKRLRQLGKEFGYELVVPANLKLCTDNAAMIGIAAYFDIQAGAMPVDPTVIDRNPGLRLD